MLRSIKEAIGYRIEASDGYLGKARDFFFDDQSWIIRYAVVDTGGWPIKREVLISPQAMFDPDWMTHCIPVDLTRQQVENSPSVNTSLPVSRRHEEQLVEYYGWEPYWQWSLGLGVSPMEPPPPVPLPQRPASPEIAPPQPHLRSVAEVHGYRIHASDGDVGHVDDFIAQTEGWAIRYLVLSTRNWLPGKRVLVSPAWVTEVDWQAKRLHIDLTRDEIKHSVEFDPSSPINREYEARLYDYYGRPAYWLGEEVQREKHHAGNAL
jgi:hypothetical protein